MKYALIGTGALGGIYGALLARAGEEVHFLLRSDYEYVSQHGITVESPLGDFKLDKPHIHFDISTIPSVDVVLICTKTTSNKELLPQLRQLMNRSHAVVMMQNGIHNEDDIKKLYPHITVIGGLCFLCSNKIGQGHIHHLDYGKVSFGLQSDADAEWAKRIEHSFAQTG